MTADEYIKDRCLEKCDFDDECDICENPENGTWVKMTCGWETEADYYICGKCIESASKDAQSWQETG